MQLYDMHSHILPGIDDGAPSVEKSLVILNELKKLTKTEDVEVISEEISSVEDTKEVEVEKTKSTKKK